MPNITSEWIPSISKKNKEVMGPKLEPGLVTVPWLSAPQFVPITFVSCPSQSGSEQSQKRRAEDREAKVEIPEVGRGASQDRNWGSLPSWAGPEMCPVFHSQLRRQLLRSTLRTEAASYSMAWVNGARKGLSNGPQITEQHWAFNPLSPHRH